MVIPRTRSAVPSSPLITRRGDAVDLKHAVGPSTGFGGDVSIPVTDEDPQHLLGALDRRVLVIAMQELLVGNR
jgi:hypothetical protein